MNMFNESASTMNLYVNRKELKELNREDSLKYYFDDNFRSHILSTIINPYDQLSLDLSNRDCVTNVSNLNNLRYLNLSGCKYIIDFKPLTEIHYLNLTSTNITDTKNLKFVNTLILDRCINICDVSELGGVKNLSLEHCHNLSDVSALGDVETLSLLNCHGLYNVSSLTNNHKLILKRCHNVSDFTNIIENKVLHTLDISYCIIKDINIFKNIPNLINTGIVPYL